MSSLDVGEVRSYLSEPTVARLVGFESFASIDSTNTYLLSQTAPEPGRFRVAVADEQTGGRGRHARRWVSPPGAGLYLSLAYAFARIPPKLPGLTLAVGVGVTAALDSLGDADFLLKWPNDIIVQDGKLGGILTEARPHDGGGITVVTGVGLNIDIAGTLDTAEDIKWSLPPADLAGACEVVPPRERLAASVVDALAASMIRFEASGFEAFADAWRQRDWLRGQHVIVDQAGQEISGIASGVGAEGSLLLEGPGGRTQVASGTIVKVSVAGVHA